MMTCVSCNGVLDDSLQSYDISHTGVELTVALEEILNHEVESEGFMCSDFSNNTVQLSQGTVPLTASHCVWCLESISGRHAHSLPEGPEKDYIAHRILPRQIQPGNKVCYACWLAARRNVSIQQNRQGFMLPPQETNSQYIAVIENQPTTSNTQQINSQPSTSNEICVWCQRSVAGHHSHSLREGPERDLIASRILPRQIEPSSRVCYACWMAARRNLRSKTAPSPNVTMNAPIRLPNYRRAGDLSSSCFVEGCANSERLTIPQFLKWKLLKMHKLYLPTHARICW